MNRTKIISFIAILVLSVSFFIGCNITDNASTEPVIGNSSGNILNRGIAAKHGEWVYFSSGEAIYREKPDGSERTRIINAPSLNLNVADDWIYYSGGNIGQISKVKTDGTGETLLYEPTLIYEYVPFMNVVGDWLYFITESYGVRNTAVLNRMKTDGSEKTVIDNNTGFINVAGDWIYYANMSENNKIYKMKTDGTEKIKLSDESANGLIVYEEWIYYKSLKDHKSYKLKTDGTGKVKLNDDISSIVNISDGWIFYTNASDKDRLYKAKLDGTEKIKIHDEEIISPSIAGDWIYFYNYDGDFYYYDYGTDIGNVYKIKTDGTGRSVTVSVPDNIEGQEVTLSNFATYANALVGEYDKPYDYFYEDDIYPIKISSIKSLKELNGETNVIVLGFEGNANHVLQYCSFFDEDGKRIPSVGGSIVSDDTISFSSDDLNLAESGKYIVFNRLAPDKNNGKWIVVFEVPPLTEQ